MKERAGTVGRIGLAPVLRALRQQLPLTRIHLIGHSFGGRVVTAAVHALDDSTTVHTMTLLQAAYSHNGLASKFDGSHDGAFRSMLVRKRHRSHLHYLHA
jgi:esterase/lipase superfamily enzyme